jgi:hypothetical protein
VASGYGDETDSMFAGQRVECYLHKVFTIEDLNATLYSALSH